jgi:heme-degrading monooxygenase HmoA
VASAQWRQGADRHRRLPNRQPGHDSRAAPSRDQGQDGWEFNADIPGRDTDAGLGRESPKGMIACGAGRAGHPWAPGQVAQAAGRDLPVRGDDQEVGVEGQVAQAEAGLGWRGTRDVVLGDHDVQITEAQLGYGSRPVALGNDGLDGRARGGEAAEGGTDQRTHDALEGRDPHRARRLAGQFGNVPFCLAKLGGDALTVGRQQLSGRGEPDLPAGAVDEAGAGLPFQGQQLLGDRRRAQVKRVGGANDAAVHGDRLQNGQPAGINHTEVLLSLCVRYYTFTFISWRTTMTGMTNARELTVRTWSATANAEGAGNYSLYFTSTLLPELRKLPGFEGAYLLRRDLDADGTVELTAHTFWESPAAVRAFAADDVTAAIVEPEAEAMLLDFDRTVTHRSVVADARLRYG